MNNFYVYALISSIDMQPFYIGKGKGNRCLDHLKETSTNTSNVHKFNKIQSILNADGEVIIVKIFNNLDNDTAYQIEELLIRMYGRKNDGGILTNICISNIPPDITGLKRSEEVIQRMSNAQKGRIISEEHRKNMSIAQQKRTDYKPLSDTHKEKLRIANTGRLRSDETKQKIRESHIGKTKEMNGFYGKTHSIESLKKISEKLKGVKRTDEFKENLSTIYKGKPKVKVICPHCGQEGGKPIMARYHFNNCKHRKSDE